MSPAPTAPPAGRPAPSADASTPAAAPPAAPPERAGQRAAAWVERQSRGRLVVVALATGLALAALVLASPVAVVLPLAVAGLAVAWLLLRASGSVTPAHCFSAALGSQVFSGHWDRLGLPIGLDRLLVAAALVLLARAWLRGDLPDIRWRPVHAALAAMLVYGLLSAIWSGTAFEPAGLFALLDRLGAVPFLAFVLAPVVYRTAAARDTLLVTLVVVGAYLGATAVLEGVGARALVVPGYINDPGVGIHFERARGPFVEAVAMGLALFLCAVGSTLAAALWRGRLARAFAGCVAVLCVVATLFTLTRAVWLATVLGIGVATLMVPALRRWVVPGGVLVVAVVGLLVVAVPELAQQVTDRSSDERPLWDRYNTNAAAVRIVAEHPLTGIGWQRFSEIGPDFLRQSPDYPITGAGIEVHNVLLSHAAELGVPGAVLFLTCLLLAVGRALVAPVPPELRLWRVALWTVAVAWAVVATFGPLSYPMPNTVLWLWAGIVATPWTSWADRAQPPAPLVEPARRDPREAGAL